MNIEIIMQEVHTMDTDREVYRFYVRCGAGDNRVVVRLSHYMRQQKPSKRHSKWSTVASYSANFNTYSVGYVPLDKVPMPYEIERRIREVINESITIKLT